MADQSLTVKLTRVNAKGVLRPNEGGMKVLIGLVADSPLDAVFSAKAMRDMLGFASVGHDIVLPAPATFVHDRDGLALETSDEKYIFAHRVLLLVKGATDSTLDAIGDQSLPITAQSFRVSSVKTQCLLSDTEVFVNLYGHCDFANMLDYRLGNDTALVLASAVQIDSVTKEKTFVIEHIKKVAGTDIQNVKNSLDTEWHATLTTAASDPEEIERHLSPRKAEYWNREVKRLRPLVSEV